MSPYSCKNDYDEKNKDGKYRQRCEEKGTPEHNRWESKLVEPLWKTVQKVLKTLKIELPDSTAVSLLSIYLKKMKFFCHVYIHTVMFITCLLHVYIHTVMFITAKFTRAMKWKQLKCPPFDNWIKKMCSICTK